MANEIKALADELKKQTPQEEAEAKRKAELVTVRIPKGKQPIHAESPKDGGPRHFAPQVDAQGEPKGPSETWQTTRGRAESLGDGIEIVEDKK